MPLQGIAYFKNEEACLTTSCNGMDSQPMFIGRSNLHHLSIESIETIWFLQYLMGQKQELLHRIFLFKNILPCNIICSSSMLIGISSKWNQNFYLYRQLDDDIKPWFSFYAWIIVFPLSVTLCFCFVFKRVTFFPRMPQIPGGGSLQLTRVVKTCKDSKL